MTQHIRKESAYGEKKGVRKKDGKRNIVLAAPDSECH